MKLISQFFLFIFCCLIDGYSQSLSKEEFLQWYLNTSSKKNFEQLIDKSSVTTSKVLLTLEKLNKKGIDTFAVVIKSFPGSTTADTCYNESVPQIAFIYWKKQGSLFLKKIKGRCEEKIIQIDSLSSLDFAINNLDTLRNEVVMPVILGAERRDGKVVYQGLFDTHHPEYILYYRVRSNSHVLRFAEDVFSNKSNWFYNENVATKSFNLFQILSREWVNSNYPF